MSFEAGDVAMSNSSVREEEDRDTTSTDVITPEVMAEEVASSDDGGEPVDDDDDDDGEAGAAEENDAEEDKDVAEDENEEDDEMEDAGATELEQPQAVVPFSEPQQAPSPAEAPAPSSGPARVSLNHLSAQQKIAEPAWAKVGTWSVGEETCKLENGNDINPLILPRPIYDQLYSYQRHGVAWMWARFRASFGGILADEMGLGKTVQICAFLAGLKESGAGTHFMVACPVTLLEMWRREAQAWGRGVGLQVHVVHGGPKERRTALRSVMKNGGILLTSYDLIRTIVDQVCAVGAPPQAAPKSQKRKRACLDDDSHSEGDGEEPAQAAANAVDERRPWDVVVVDEAHRIKNPSCIAGRALRCIKARCRLLLTGTPLQNRLSDIWSLMDFCQPGLLGNHATFDRNFSEQIAKGSKRNASRFAVELKDHLSRELKRLTGPHFLRRTKAEVSGKQEDDQKAAIEELPPKTDVVLWLSLTSFQREMYQHYLESDLVRRATGKQKCGMEALRAIALFKKLCNHPLLCLPVDEQHAWRSNIQSSAQNVASSSADAPAPSDAQVVPAPGSDAAVADEQDNVAEGTEDKAARACQEALKLLRAKLPSSVEEGAALSCKLRVLQVLLPALEKSGHRVLIFSQSTRMLDLAQLCVLRPLGLRFLRIDGTIDPRDRDGKVSKFQTNDRYFACCLSTAVGGVGLTLTGADRVILLDPAWNPAMDEQAVDRVHRIGQSKDVVVYRLICSGAIEDKMFRLQVFKRGLAKSTFEAANQMRFFSQKELKSLFEPLSEASQTTTQELMAEQLGAIALEHADLLETVQQDVGDPEDEHALFWRSRDIQGFSDYHQLFTKLETAEGGDAEAHEAQRKAQEIREALQDEEYIKDQVTNGEIKPSFRKSSESSPGKEKDLADTTEPIPIENEPSVGGA